MRRMSETRVWIRSITRPPRRTSFRALEPPSFDRALAEERVGENEAGHRLGHRYHARAEARIVAAVDRELALLPGAIHRLLLERDRRGRLHRDPGHDRLPGRDAAQHAAGVVRREPARGHPVVVLAPAQANGSEAVADLEPLDGGDRHEAPGEAGVELVDHGIAETDGNARCERLDHAPQRIARLARGKDRTLHLGGDLAVGAADGVLLHEVEIALAGHEIADLHGAALHAHADPLEDPARERAGGDAPHRFAPARAAAPAVVAHAVLLPVGEVGVSWAVEIAQLIIVLRARVHAPHDERDRGAGGHALEDAGEDLDLVGLLALGRDRALAGLPAVEVLLDGRGVDDDAGRHAVDDHADAGPVAL